MSRIYHETTPLIYKNITQDSPIRLVFLSGMGTPVRQQREGFFRRFALTSGISYTALDYTRYVRQYKRSENFQIPSIIPQTTSILESFPEEKFLLFGPCVGGLVGLIMTQKMPQKIAGAVITSPACEIPSFPWIEQADKFLHHKVEEKTQKKRATYNQLKRLAILHQLFMATVTTISKTPLVRTYQGPMTIFHGQKDPLIPVENSFRIQEALQNPNLQLRIVPNVKHTVAFDKEMKQPISILKQYLDRSLGVSN